MPERLKLAAICTAYFPMSHAQHIVDRFLEGYGWEGRHHVPDMDVVALYVEQRGENDVSQKRIERYDHLTGYDTVEAALTRGGDTLAVDGVLLIGEHGEYPTDDYGYRHYPRYELFQRIVDVFERSGRCVPVFNDKHLSYDWDKARAMHDTARRMGFALMGGSSLPVVERFPDVDMPDGAPINEAVSVSYGAIDAYDFHALEAIQCMVERRAGGETGVKWIEAKRGDDVWRAIDQGACAPELLEACLARSDALHLGQVDEHMVFPTTTQLRQCTRDPIMYQYEHRDGLRCTMLMLNGLVGGWTFAASAPTWSTPLSTRMHLRMPDFNRTESGNVLATFFSPLTHHIERLMHTGASSWPSERNLLTTGLTIAGVQSLGDGQPLDTPHLDIRYAAPAESQHARH